MSSGLIAPLLGLLHQIGQRGDPANATGSLHAKIGNVMDVINNEILYVMGADLSGAPGPKFPMVGDRGLGYFGFVPASELITGNTLASNIGLSAGTAINSNAGWLKWIRHGIIMFVALKPLRYNLSWDHINARGAVFGTRTVSIGGKTYKVRLLTGGDADPAEGAGGEWNLIMYGAHKDMEPNWDGYSDADLVTISSAGNGSYSWCQETSASYPTDRVVRGGYSGVAGFSMSSPSDRHESNGWRPVLELLP